MECYAFMRNVVDILANGKTAYQARFCEYMGPCIPFGALVSYKPITARDKDRCHKMGPQLLRGIFIGYDDRSGGSWSGDLLIVDWEELEDAETTSEVYTKRFKAAEMFSEKVDGYCFPCAEGDLRQPGLDHREVRCRRRKKNRYNGEPEKNEEKEDSPDEEEEEDEEPPCCPW